MVSDKEVESNGVDTLKLPGEADETPKRKIPYPRSVFFIFGNEFCERFSFYGMKTILTLYLTNELGYSDSSATVTYHVFNLFCYFTPLFGAIIADSYWGKFKTITYISVLYAIGNIIVALSSAPIDGLPQAAITIIGLAVIAVGTGGIKPCVSAFGGDQFVLPDQERELQQFFSVFYFSINAGSLISTFLTPILREDVHCFGNNSCYPLAFGVPAVLMVVALVLFVLGKPMYTIREPEGNMVVEVSKCMGHAMSKKWKGKDVTKDHWLDYADDKFDKQLISDIKAVMKVLTLYVPLPIFWTLFDQQGSRWTLQATRMDGRLSDDFTLKPDQMQVINPLLILGLIPLFESIVYPLFHKIGLLKRPLQKMVVGMIFAGIAFAISGFVELKLREGYPLEPSGGSTRLVFTNTLNCSVTLNSPEIPSFTILEQDKYELKKVPAGLSMVFSANASDGCADPPTWATDATIESGEERNAYSVLVLNNGLLKSEKQEYEKPRQGLPLVRITYNLLPGENGAAAGEVLVATFKGKKTFSLELNGTSGSTEYYDETEPGEYTLWNNQTQFSPKKMEFLLGAVYEVTLVQEGDNQFALNNYVITKPSEVHMLWLIPQYIVITTAEILFSPTGYEFSFTQSPTSMKAVIQSGWLLSIAFGNLIVVIVAEAEIFEDQFAEFFFFAALIWLFAVIFSFMAYRYKYQDFSSPDDNNGEKKRRPSIGSIMGQELGLENKGFDHIGDKEKDSKF